MSTCRSIDCEVKREELAYLLGERSDFVAARATTIADNLNDGNCVDYRQIAELRGALEAIEIALTTVEGLRDLE
jgi:hypothetical protein